MDERNLSPHILIGLDAAVATLTEKFLSEGQLPNLSQLIRRGAYTRAASVFPGVTPINWATISTGAYPGTHGITDFHVLNPGDLLNAGRDAFLRSSYRAESIWEAALCGGLRCGTLDFPGAETSQHPNHFWIAERGSPAGHSPYAIRSVTCLSTPDLDLRDSLPLELEGQTFSVDLAPQYAAGKGPRLFFQIGADLQGNQGVVCRLGSTEEDGFILRPGETSHWLWAEFEIDGVVKQASFCLKLARFNPHIPSFAVYVSQITSPRDIASPPELGEVLVNQIGPFIGYDGARAVDRGWVGAQQMIDDGLYKALWQARAARFLIEQYDCRLVMLKWHLIDHIQHAFWGGIDPLSPWYDSSDHATCEALILAAYQAADAMIGALLPLLDQGVTLTVVSDHGHIPHLKAVALNNLLLKEGLIQLMDGEGSLPQVDWWRTQAYGGPAPGDIRVNPRGPFSQGCGNPQSYEDVRERVIDLLTHLRDPETHQRVVEKVFRKEEARAIGLWGDRTGDIVYWMKPGYSGDFNWTPLAREGNVFEDLTAEREGFADYGEGRFIADKFQSVHGCGDPQAKLGVGTEEAILAMAGPAVRPGAQTDEVPNLTCVVPTMCRASGLPLPSQNEGEVLDKWF